MKSVLTVLKVAGVLEVLLCAVIALLVVFNGLDVEAAKSAALKVTLAIAVVAVAAALIGMMMGRGRAETPKP